MNKDYPFFYGASPNTFEKSRTLRKSSTQVEQLLWQRLKNKKLEGLKFRRQHPIGQFIVDFYCNDLKLVIELDGSIHEIDYVSERDQGREFMLKELGLKILRFSNSEVEGNIEKVIEKILSFIKS